MSRELVQAYLMVSDLDASISFYTGALGLDVRDRSDRRATLETGACELVLEEDFSEDTLSEFGLSPPGHERGDGAILVLVVDDVDAVYEQAASTEASIRCEPQDVSWGRRMFLIDDPDGYLLEVSRPL